MTHRRKRVPVRCAEARTTDTAANGPHRDRRKVAATIIVRDAVDSIGRAVSSVRDWVDEVHVLDTGSLDGTQAEAARHGAIVSAFAWCDDFSAARNACLDVAQADWHFVLDADEWLIEGGSFLRQLALTSPAFVGAIALQDHDGTRGSQCSTHWLSRVLPGPVRYDGCIHEQPVHALPVRRVPMQVAHDGYSEAALARKRGRNRRLLHQALRARPDDAYLLYQLGKDEAVYEEHMLASRHLLQACTRAADDVDWRPALVARCLYSLKCVGDHAQAAALAAQEIDKAAETLCTQSPDVFFALGDVMLDWAVQAPERAAELLVQAEQAWSLCLELGERPDITGSVQGRGSHLAAHNLALVYEETGRKEQAQQLRKRFGLETPVSPG